MKFSKSEHLGSLGVKSGVLDRGSSHFRRFLDMVSGAEIGEWSTDVILPNLMYPHETTSLIDLGMRL